MATLRLRLDDVPIEKAWYILTHWNEGLYNHLINPNLDIESLPNVDFEEVQEYQNKPTIRTGVSQAFKGKNYSEVIQTFTQNQEGRKVFNVNLDDFDKYCFYTGVEFTTIEIYDDMTVVGTNPNFIFYGLKQDGTFQAITNFDYTLTQNWICTGTVGGTYGTINSDRYFDLGGRLRRTQIEGTFKVSAKVFKTANQAKAYLKYGTTDGEVGKKETINERNIETLYLKSTVYRSVTSSRTQAVKVETHKWEFDVQRYNDNGTQINKWNRGVIGFVNDTNTGHYNLGFMENTATKNLLKIRVDGVEVSKNSFSWVTGLTTYTENTKDVIEDQAYFYWSDISTNMYIFDTLYHAQQVIEGIEEGIIKMFEGDDLTNTQLNDNDLDFDTDMSDCFVLDQADVQALARRFNAYVTSDGSIISDLFVGLGIHENPIDCNIDLFEMPIDVTGFCETEHYIVKFSPRVTRNPDPERQPEE